MTNQPPPLDEFDPLACDPVLGAAISRTAVWCLRSRTSPSKPGRVQCASMDGWPISTDRLLHTHNRYGDRIDEVEFHPSWHWLMGRAVAHRLHAAPWAPDVARAAHLIRAAGFYLWTQVEAGHGCPLSMTYAAVPALRHCPELSAQ